MFPDERLGAILALSLHVSRVPVVKTVQYVCLCDDVLGRGRAVV